MEELKHLKRGLQVHPLPPCTSRNPNVPHAPFRVHGLTANEQKLAIRNALRYFPEDCHSTLAAEFAQELKLYGHIYMYRFRPQFRMKAYPLQWYPTRTTAAAAIAHMIMNNLDPDVAQFPEELVTYGGNGQAFSNWAQFWIIMKYLCDMDNEQTLVIYSGHPMGLFPSNAASPRMVITNGMVIPNYSSQADYARMFGLNVSMYGQMTAGSYCYIGPQGIVHGTTLTILNAARKYLGVENMAGKVFVSSGLGGMSGAQPKAAIICGCIAVIAEVNYDALQKRFQQNWLQEIYSDMDELINRIRTARKNKDVTSIGYHGNIVTLWERLVEEYKRTGESLVDLGSDQTSCHDPYEGGYFPVQITFDEGNAMLANDPKNFRKLVKESLCRHVSAINFLTDRGMKFWDYGNAFMLEASRAGADVTVDSESSCPKFRYPSYVQDIMGDIFSLGFGPFRWVCTSASTTDLEKTDEIALRVLLDIVNKGVPKNIQQQYSDNIHWIKHAAQHQLVVGSQARILYSDQNGRIQIALAFNKAVAEKKLQGPVVISRDHHDVSGTDSPFRETSNIEDGSSFTADMAVQNCIGDAFRGATWVALHNGGGVGWGEVINGGFGLLLDGSDEAAEKVKLMLQWDVSNGVARRCWAGNVHAYDVIQRTMERNPKLHVTLPHAVTDESVLENIL